MKKQLQRLLLLSWVLCTLTSCGTVTTDSTAESIASTVSKESKSEVKLTGLVSDTFNAYWYQGKAELTSYTLEQARYGEIHQGHAVLIFVTEDFSRSKQVKLDDPAQAGDDSVKVMKLNLTKKFNTGIYPYSMMTSVFTPVERKLNPQTLKITTSSQEWCGHTFVQMNLNDQSYRIQQNSYFESEGDKTLTLEGAIPEDELWTTIRLNPEDLPTGKLQLIPGTMFQRLRHLSWTIQSATAQLKPVEGNSQLVAYTLTYPELERTLSIEFNKAFPHEIESWEETYQSGWGQGAKVLTTKAQRKKRILLDYWTKHNVADEVLRRELDLD